MITRDLHVMTNPEWSNSPIRGTLEQLNEWAGTDPLWKITPYPHCRCCGLEFDTPGSVEYPNGQVRCAKHHDRNPCAIEGCRRTTHARVRFRDNDWLCGEHWRRYVPPRSRARRVYHGYFRRARRVGWTDERVDQFDRFWAKLVQRVRQAAENGHLDVDEIHRIMGW